MSDNASLVLLARPHPMIARLMGPVLEEAGMRAGKLSSLDKLDKAMGAGPIGAVISTSVSSSVEASVEEVFHELRKKDSEIPIVLTTLIKDHQWIPKLFSSGVRESTRFVDVDADSGVPTSLSRRDVPVLEKDFLSERADLVADLFRRHFRV